MAYFEGKLSFNTEDPTTFSEILSTYNELGLKNIVIELEDPKELQSISLTRLLSKYRNLNFFYRLNIRTENINEYKTKLKKCKNLPFVISIESSNKDIQLNAAKDNRVDLLSFSTIPILRSLTTGVLSLTRQFNTFLEFSLAPIMIESKYIQSKNFRLIYKSIQLSLKSKTSFIITGNFRQKYDCRHPKTLLSVSHTLLDLPYDIAKKCFSKNIELLLYKRSNPSENQLINSDYRIFYRREQINEKK